MRTDRFQSKAIARYRPISRKFCLASGLPASHLHTVHRIYWLKSLMSGDGFAGNSRAVDELA